MAGRPTACFPLHCMQWHKQLLFWRDAPHPGRPSDRLKPSAGNLLPACSFKRMDFQFKLLWKRCFENTLYRRAIITRRFPSGTASPAHCFTADWSLQHAWLVTTMGYWVVRKQMSKAGRNEIRFFSVLKQQLDTVGYLSDMSLAIKLCNLVGALQKIKSQRFVDVRNFEHPRMTGRKQLIYSSYRRRGNVKKRLKCVTLDRVLKVLNAPDLKMTRFLLHRMKATIPITTINKKRGVRTAMIHRLPGGVFTTAACRDRWEKKQIKSR